MLLALASVNPDIPKPKTSLSGILLFKMGKSKDALVVTYAFGIDGHWSL